MKKLGFVIPWFAENIPGGAEMELRGLTKNLALAGVDLEILTTCVREFASDWNVNYYKEGSEIINGIMVRRFKVRKRCEERFHKVNYKFMNGLPVSLEEEDIFLQEMVNSDDLYDYMRVHTADYALFIFIPYMFGTTYFGAQVCPSKTVLIPCLHDESYAYMERFKQLYPNIAGMIFHARPEMELAQNLYDLKNVQVGNLGEGVNTDINGIGKRFVEKYHLKEPFIIYAGRKDSGKNVETLIKYFGEYKERNRGDLKLVLIGGGEIEIPESKKEEIIDLGFIPIQDKYDAYDAAVMLCQPSKNESFSLVIMESWLCEKPVIVHNECKVTKNFVIEAGGGLYFENYFEFEGCVNYILKNPEIAKSMGMNGKQYVSENFSWNAIVRKYTEFFERLSINEKNRFN